MKFCFVFAVVILLSSINHSFSCEHGHGHGHDHGHDHHHGHHHHHEEPIESNPSFKYSRAANEKAAKPVVEAVHAHSHGEHNHEHSHDHKDNHAHSHDHHGHQHSIDKKDAKAQEEKQAHDHHRHETKEKSRDKFTIALHAISSTLLISIAPFIILFFIPLNNNGVENQSLLKVLLGFASGSLLGDAFLHLIPHALNPHDHTDEDHSHSHESGHGHDHSKQAIVGLWVLAGIMAFLLVEKIVRNLNGHSHSHETISKAIKSSDDESDKEKKGKKKDSKKPVKKEEKKEEIQIAGYLNLVADFSHNFTDGLAIGASFLAGQNIGLVTTCAILFHEVPHEIGDFAILIQSGCSKRKAIFLQLFTALGALSGTLLSLVFESTISGFATSCILPFTAGGFIYIATVSIIPELKESTGFIQSIKEVLALCAGVAMMVLIAIYE